MDNYCRTKTTFNNGCCRPPQSFMTKEVTGVDDTKYPPANGEGFNMIVKYTKTGNIYLYDSFGIPTKIGGQIPLDDFLSLTSNNAVENRVITEAVNQARTDVASMQNSINGIAALLDAQYKELIQKIKEAGATPNVMVYDPFTGELSPIQQVISNLFGWAQTDALTAEEFDTLEITASDFDEKEITSHQFDTASKLALGAEDTTGLEFGEESVEIIAGQTSTQTITVTPETGITPIRYTSSDTDVATVVGDRRSVTITAVAPGDAVITATAGEATADLPVTVVAAE